MFEVAILIVGLGVGFLWGKALFRYQLETEGWDVMHDDSRRLGEGRYRVVRRLGK